MNEKNYKYKSNYERLKVKIISWKHEKHEKTQESKRFVFVRWVSPSPPQRLSSLRSPYPARQPVLPVQKPAETKTRKTCVFWKRLCKNYARLEWQWPMESKQLSNQKHVPAKRCRRREGMLTSAWSSACSSSRASKPHNEKNLQLRRNLFLHFHLNFGDFTKNMETSPPCSAQASANFFHKSAGGLKVEESNFHPQGQGLRKTMEM